MVECLRGETTLLLVTTDGETWTPTRIPPHMSSSYQGFTAASYHLFNGHLTAISRHFVRKSDMNHSGHPQAEQ